MFSHTIVLVILSILSVTAAYAAGMPVSKSFEEQQDPTTGAKEPKDTL